MNDIQTIALNLLDPSKANVRRTGQKDGIEELAASIAAHGLRQNLNVTATESGRFEVVAGGRRLRALKLLVKQGKLAKDAPIACRVLADDDDPAEISLVENTLRTAMHPDDQCIAFRGLIEDKGVSVEDVAARFGVTPAVVRRRLKLAQVSPKLRIRFRKGEISLEQMMAFTLSDDHAAQEAVWKNLTEWNREPEDIREALSGEALPMTDKLARFVGEDSYVAAGGCVLRDLFDDANGGYLPDRALVLRLAEEKLQAVAEEVRAEGWQWVITETRRDYGTRYGRVRPQPEGEEEGGYLPEDMARAGARLSIAHDGTLDIDRGLIHPDMLAAEHGEGAGTHTRATSKPKADPAILPASLVEDLTAHRTAALQVMLAGNPTVALAATVHGLALSLLYPGYGAGSCLTLRGSTSNPERHTKAPGDCPAHATMEAEAERWGDRLPGEAAELWGWCLAQPQDVLLDLLAYLAALTVNAVQEKHDRPDCDRLTHSHRLAEALGLAMAEQWKPTVDGFYGRISKAALAEAVRDAGKGDRAIVIPTLKKDAAARHASQVLDGCGWLPAPLRTVAAAEPEADQAEAELDEAA